MAEPTQKIRIELSREAEKYVRADAPREVRLMASRGALPLPPVELASVPPAVNRHRMRLAVDLGAEGVILRDDMQFEADGVPLYQWVEDFVNGDPGWVDIVEDFVPAP